MRGGDTEGKVETERKEEHLVRFDLFVKVAVFRSPNDESRAIKTATLKVMAR